MATPERPDGGGPGPLPAIIGGVVVALVLIWLVGIIASTFVLLVRLAVLVALVVAGFWVWGKVSRD
jgi:hypothetical protein